MCAPVDKFKRREIFIKLFPSGECVPAPGGEAERKGSPGAGRLIKREWMARGKIRISVGGY